MAASSDFFLTSCGPSFSGYRYATQISASTYSPRSDGFRLFEFRVSRTFLDFLRTICSGNGYPARGVFV